MAVMQYRPSGDAFGSLFENFMAPFAASNRMADLLRAPEADVVERENEIGVMLEMPGMKPEDINIDLDNNVLTISGEKHEERTEGDERSTWHLSERRYGKFSRSFVLPRDVEPDGIQARFEDGVLNISVPKSERARRRRIEVQNGGNGQTKRVESGTPSRKG